MASADPLAVTVLMAAYDRLPLLEQSLYSALQQDYPNFEVLVIDDGSSQQTYDWLETMSAEYDRLRVIHQLNQGVASSRQNGLEATTTPLVCILDSDDLLRPQALSRICREFSENPEIALVYVDNLRLLPCGREECERYPRYATAHNMLKATLVRPQVPFKHSGTTFRREVALDLGGYNRSLPLKIDVDLFLKFLCAGKHLHLLPETLVSFRIHRNSLSAARWQGIRVWWQLIAQYGPQHRMKRFYFQFRRTVVELLKAVYAFVYMR